MPGYSAHQFCRRTASSATPRTRAKANKEQPLSHAAGLHSPLTPLTTRDWIGSYSAPLLPLWAPAPTPSCTFLERHPPPTTHGPSVSLVPPSINQSITQSTKPNSSVVFNSRLSFCAHLHPHSINHDGQIFFSTVLVDSDRCAFHRRVCYSRSHCNQGMRSSKQDVVKRVPSI
jgi:hypothetical protein